MGATRLPEVYRIDGGGGPDPFAREFDSIVNAIRLCRLDEAEAAAARVVARASAPRAGLARDVRLRTLGRAYSFLGEVDGMRGNLQGLVRHYKQALGHLSEAGIAGSMSRAYRGFAQAYLFVNWPLVAIDAVQSSFECIAEIDRERTRLRCQYECDVVAALAYAALGRVSEARRHADSAAALRATVTRSHDAWLPGLTDLARGQSLLAHARTEAGDAAWESGVASLKAAVRHYERARLGYWLAISREYLARALEDVDRDQASEAASAAYEAYNAMGALHQADQTARLLKRIGRPQRHTTAEHRRSVERVSLKPEELLIELRDTYPIVVAGPATREVVELALRTAHVDRTVLIYGESGSGKEALARLIHERSSRARAPYVEINCAATASELIAAELFGYEKGAFTGAVGSKRGKFEAADGGTIFLDEVAKMSPDLQNMLLKVIEDGRFTRLGSNERRQVNVRIIAATNMNLETLAADGKFLPDLYYRLAVLKIYPYPLRERMDEVYHLARHFAGKQGYEIDHSAVEALMDYDWPGNVRELVHVVDRAILLAGAYEEDCLTYSVLVEAIDGRREYSRPPGRATSPLKAPAATAGPVWNSAPGEDVFDPARTNEITTTTPAELLGEWVDAYDGASGCEYEESRDRPAEAVEHAEAADTPETDESADAVPRELIEAVAQAFSGLGLRPAAVEQAAARCWAGRVATSESEVAALIAAARFTGEADEDVRTFETVQEAFGTAAALTFFASRRVPAAATPTGSRVIPESIPYVGGTWEEPRLNQPLTDAVKLFQRYHIEQAIAETGGNLTAAARLLGYDRAGTEARPPYKGLQSLRHKMDALGIKPPAADEADADPVQAETAETV